MQRVKDGRAGGHFGRWTSSGGADGGCEVIFFVCAVLTPLVGMERTILRRIVEEVPNQDRVVVRTAHDLELVELQPEHAAGVFL